MKPILLPSLAVLALGLGLSPGKLRAHGALHERIARASDRVAARPEDPQPLLERAELLREHRDFDRALADLARVRELDPGGSESLRIEARIALDRREPEEAKRALDHYLTREPGSPEGYLLRSEAHQRLDEWSAAVADARLAIRHRADPQLSDHLHLIGLLKAKGARKDTAAAFESAREARGLVPSLLTSQAEWLAATGDRPAAAKIYGELRRAVPALGFHAWVAEARLWSGHDEARTSRAKTEAERVWSELTPAIRTRAAMVETRRELDKVTD